MGPLSRATWKQEAPPLELRQYLEILRRHKWFIIELVLVVGVAAGVVSNMRTPLYKSTARVLLTPNDPTQQLNPTNGPGVVGNDPDRYVLGQINIVESEAVAAEAVKSLPGISVAEVEQKLSVNQTGRSNVLKISATDPEPRRARDVAQAVAKGYIENRRVAAVSGLQGAADDIQAKLEPLQAQIAQLDTQIGEGTTLPGATTTVTSPTRPASAAPLTQPTAQVAAGTGTLGGAPTTQESLKAARYAAAVQYETLYSRQQELLVDISLKRGDAELIADAKAPSAPVSPHPARDAGLGVIVGALLGIGGSIVREQLNDRIRSTQEVERLTGLPMLAQLPYDEDAGKVRSAGLAMFERAGSPLSEAVRSLRTSIQYLGVDRPLKIVMVTSAVPGEGKSLVAANLAAAFAQADYRTILISADLRRSSLEAIFTVSSPSPGLTGVLAPMVSRKSGGPNADRPPLVRKECTPAAADALLRTSVPGLLLLPAGPTPPNPAELLGSHRMANLLAELADQADMLILDSPPLLPVTDAAVLAAKCDGVILVTALNETRRDGLLRAKKILDGTGTTPLGIVVNKSPTAGKSGYYYGGYYGEIYREGSPSTVRRRSRRRRARGPIVRPAKDEGEVLQRSPT